MTENEANDGVVDGVVDDLTEEQRRLLEEGHERVAEAETAQDREAARLALLMTTADEFGHNIAAHVGAGGMDRFVAGCPGCRGDVVHDA